MAEAQRSRHPSETPMSGAFDTIFGELQWLRNHVETDETVCVAVLDGPVDLGHPCFRSAPIRRIDSLVTDKAGDGPMSTHGTHVASVILGDPSTGVLGLAFGCRGLVVPVFRDTSGHLSQLDLARAIDRAVTEGADVINISGGQYVSHGQPDPLLSGAIDKCERAGVLVVAAAGNDGCDCVHVPAVIRTVLAAGALGRSGKPLDSSNFGDQYTLHGVLAPGEAIPGAVPGGGLAALTGSSFAAPIVSALAALLLSEQRRLTGGTDVAAVRDAILASALPCIVDADESTRCLGGIVNVRGAHALIRQGGKVSENNTGLVTHVAAPGGATVRPLAGVVPSAAAVEGDQQPSIDTGTPPAAQADSAPPQAAFASTPPVPGPGHVAPQAEPTAAPPAVAPYPAAAAPPAAAVSASCGTGDRPSCSCGAGPSAEDTAPPAAVESGPVSLVFAIGNVGFDFGTEARRDGFRQLMPPTIDNTSPETLRPANPYDYKQMADFLEANEWDSTQLIFTLDHDKTPVYVIEPDVPYAHWVYKSLREALRNQVLDPEESDYVSRVSLPGILTTRTRTLFSGQKVPVVVAQQRGLWAWTEKRLVEEVVSQLDLETMAKEKDESTEAVAKRVRLKVRQMLDKAYFQLRNLGVTPQDRAINYMATNAFQFAETIAKGLLSGEYVDGDRTSLYSLDSITAVKSAYCPPTRDCWDVQMSFFAPDNHLRARVVYQGTFDVSDALIVPLSPIHQFLETG